VYRIWHATTDSLKLSAQQPSRWDIFRTAFRALTRLNLGWKMRADY
jgi:hypothetical protein